MKISNKLFRLIGFTLAIALILINIQCHRSKESCISIYSSSLDGDRVKQVHYVSASDTAFTVWGAAGF